MKLSTQHPFYRYVPQIQALAQPLFASTEITGFNFSRYYEDGYAVELSSVHPELVRRYLEEHLYPTRAELQAYAKMSNYAFIDSQFYDHLSVTDPDKWHKVIALAKEFRFSERFYILEEHPGYYEIYGFNCDIGNTKTIQYFTERLRLLQSFIKYFKAEAAEIIQDCHENRFKLDSDYFDPHSKPEVLQTQEEILAQIPSRDIPQTLGAVKMTPAEGKCLKLLVNGYTMKEAARELGISHRTVERHIQNLMRKCGANSSKQLIKQYCTQNDMLMC